MPISLQLSYKPLSLLPEDPKVPVELSLSDHRRFVEQSGLVDLVNQIAIKPFEEALRADERKTFQFKETTINKNPVSKTNVSWTKIRESLDHYLDIRADDARAEKTEGMFKVEGVGYCIPITDLINYIEKLKGENTNISSSMQLSWPKGKIVPPTREIIIPGNLNYAKPNNASAEVVQQARKFRKSVEDEVVDRYKQIQKRWLEQQTGFSKNNIPPENTDQEETPTKMWRRVGDNVYTVINIVRENRTDYGEAIRTLLGELNTLAKGDTIEGYRCSRTEVSTLVNIQTVKKRLEKLYKDNTSPDVRYEMSP